MPDVFVSYRHTDGELVDLLAKGLERGGIDVWFDRADIGAGDRWRERIAQAIREIRAMVVVVGPTGVGGVQGYEVDLAFDRSSADPDFPIVPVVLPNAKLDGRQWANLSTRSYVSLEDGLTDESLERLVSGINHVHLSIEPMPDPVIDREPYPGLRSFDDTETDLFFGRREEVEQLLGRCAKPGLAAVIGPSGLGKSSLVRAGLLPHLAALVPERALVWHHVTCSPGRAPIESFATALAQVASVAESTSATGVAAAARTDPSIFTEQAQLAVSRLGDRAGLVILIDQLEEMFTKGCDREERDAFARNIAHLGDHCPDDIRLVVTLRSDFLVQLLEHEDLCRLINAYPLMLAPITDEGLRDVIQLPAWECNVRLEPKLVDVILDDARNQPNALPLLALALQKMWAHRDGNRLTVKTYIDGGRVPGALNELAERVVEPYLPADESLVRATLLRLVRTQPGSPPTRRRRRMVDLQIVGDVADVPGRLIEGLAASRLVIRDLDEVEFAHDAMISAWERLRGWAAAASGNDELVRQSIEAAAAEWVKQDRSAQHLGSIGLVQEASPLLTAGRLQLSPVELEFLARSRQAAASARRRRRYVWGALGLAACLLIGVVILARKNADQRHTTREAAAARLAAQASSLTTRPDLAIRLAVNATAQSKSAAVRSALLSTLSQPAQLLGIWGDRTGGAISAATPGVGDSVVLGTAQGEIRSCVVSARSCSPVVAASGSAVVAVESGADGTTAVLRDGTLLFEAADASLTKVPKRDGDADVTVAAIAPTGLVVLGLSNGSIVLRSSSGVRDVTTVGGAPRAVAISPDGAAILVATSNEVTLWTSSGTRRATIPYSASAVAFDAHADRVIVAAVDTNDVLVWNIAQLTGPESGPSPVHLIGHTRNVKALTVDDRNRLLSVDDGGEVRQWRLDRPRPGGAVMIVDTPLGEPALPTVGAHFVMRGERVLVVGQHTMTEWSALGRPAIGQAIDGIDDATAIAVEPGTDNIVAATAGGELIEVSSDGRRRSIASGAPLRARSVVVLATGEVVVGGTGLAVFDLATGVRRATRPDLIVTALAVSSSPGRSVAVGTDDGVALVVSADDLRDLSGPFETGRDPIADIAVSGDGSWLSLGREHADDPNSGANVQDDNDVVVIDLRSGSQTALSGHSAEVTAVEFSPDGKVLATGSDDRTIILWSTTKWTASAILTGHTDRVRRLAFGGTGMLMSAGDDATMRWWDVADRSSLGLPLRWNDTGRIDDVQNGTQHAFALIDQHVVSWETSPAQWVAAACSIATRPPNASEARAYLSGWTGPDPCPQRG